MLSVSRYICKNTYISTILFVQVRNKTKTHWAKLRKKTGPKYKALNHFNEFYGSVFGEKWEPMREAMLKRSKYVALINNFGNAEESMEILSKKGAHCLKNLISIQKEFTNHYSPPPDTSKSTENKQIEENGTNKLEQYAERLQSEEIAKLYPQTDNMPEMLDFSEKESREEDKKIAKDRPIQPRTLDQSMSEAVIDESRIIDPSMGMTSELLYQFLPATKLKGMDDWVSESTHYAYYSKDKDFPLVLEPDTELNYPEHLKVYTYEMDSEWTMFPEPKRSDLGVFNYYPMDAGSVLSVLALGLCPGDRVLDMCSAPGGKALVALQTLLPDVIICNDVSVSRCNRTQRVFKDYLIDFETSNKWRERVIIKRVDGRDFVDDQGFDKVLVDVPCTTDRHSLNEDDNNMFRPDRVRERLRIPELQSHLLLNALRLVNVGGTVVYSTCSLSPVQNDGVVHSALKLAFENHNIVANVKDMTASLSGFSSTLQLGTDAAAPKYGQLVTPCSAANFGPSYIAKLVRVK